MKKDYGPDTDIVKALTDIQEAAKELEPDSELKPLMSEVAHGLQDLLGKLNGRDKIVAVCGLKASPHPGIPDFRYTDNESPAQDLYEQGLPQGGDTDNLELWCDTADLYQTLGDKLKSYRPIAAADLYLSAIQHWEAAVTIDITSKRALRGFNAASDLLKEVVFGEVYSLADSIKIYFSEELSEIMKRVEPTLTDALSKADPTSSQERTT